MRAGLRLFEAMSGLKVNFHKSFLVGVNINASWLAEAAFALRCKLEKSRFSIWVFRLGAIHAGYRFGSLWLIVLNLDCLVGIVVSYLLVAG